MEQPILINFIMKVRILDVIYLPFHVLLKAFATKKKLPKKINQFVNNYKNEKLPKKYEIIFTLWKDGFSSLLNAKAVPPNYILVSPEWATKLLLYNDEATQNAFLITLGHEITHNEGDFPDINYRKGDKRFINWVNEVHADFGAAEKMVNSDRQKLKDSMQYKMDAKKKPRCKFLNNFIKKVLNLLHSDEYTHPTWETRLEYAKTGAFNKALIEAIAKQTGCTNNKLINDISKFYGDIVLKD